MSSSDLVTSQSFSCAFEETLDLLDWPLLCENLSTFCSTDEGRRKSKHLALPPDLSTSRLKLAETLEVGELDQLLEGGLQLQGVHYLGDVLRRCVKGGIANGEELLSIAVTLASARRLRRQIEDPESRPVLSALFVDLATLPKLERMLKFGLEDGGRVADRASAKLALLRRRSHTLRLKRKDRLIDIQRRYSAILQDSVISERRGRPVLVLKAGSSDQVPGMIHDSSASGSTIFLEPNVVIPLGNQITEIETHIAEEEQILLAGWSNEVANNFSSLSHIDEVMLQLDIALARARYGYWLGGVAPSLDEDPLAPFVFHGLRHPLLVWQECYGNGSSVVPISIEVSSEIRVVAITGPNTGGKTVTLKSVGLVSLMARAGMLLPCIGRPSLPWCDQVLADIGDEQSLQQNLSTFSGHVMRIGRIFQAISIAKGPVLVLLDEVGAGTDPSEGTALATALLKILAERVRLTIATTHFGELKALKYNDKRFENASVAFDSETVSPKYHLQWGIPGRSNALAIAKRLGLDSDVLDKARDLIAETSGEDINQVIKGLEEQRYRQQQAAEEAAALLARTELLHEELLSRWEEQRMQSAEVQAKGRQKLEASIRDGQKEVRRLIRRLRDEGANGETARKVGQSLRRIEINQLSQTSKLSQRDWSPKVGDRIRLRALGKAGEVLEVSDDGSQLTVICGIFRSTVDVSAVESLDGRRPKLSETFIKVSAPSSSAGSGSKIRTKKNTLDVRGLRVYEAESVIEENMRNISGPIWVIHGIGTGKLKRGLRKWLESLPYVDKVTDADQRDGGPGCSVVWFRQ